MDEICDWEFEPPSLSFALSPKFLARVHPFTAVGLEAQATAFSFGADGAEGMIRYLAVLPQHKRVCTLEEIDKAVYPSSILYKSFL